jgi:Ulp1 family protease
MAISPELCSADRLCLFRNVSGSHWYVIVADPIALKYYILDSLGPRFETVLPSDRLRRMPEVLDLISAIRGEALSEGWRQAPVFFPKQTNGYDCGLFAVSGVALTLAGASPATLGYLPWLQQDQMVTRRREAAVALMNGVVPESWRKAFADAICG